MTDEYQNEPFIRGLRNYEGVRLVRYLMPLDEKGDDGWKEATAWHSIRVEFESEEAANVISEWLLETYPGMVQRGEPFVPSVGTGVRNVYVSKDGLRVNPNPPKSLREKVRDKLPF